MKYTDRNTNLNIYFNEIRKAESLTRDAEVDIFNRISLGDSKALDELVMRMSKLAVAIAKTYTNDPERLEDCIQDANLGILKAAEKFDLSMDIRFSTYARWWMKMMICAGLGVSSGPFRKKSPELERNVRRIRSEFYTENRREPSEYEILDILEKSGVKVYDMSALYDICTEPVCLTDDEGMEYENPSMSVTAEPEGCEKTFDEESVRLTVKRKMRVLCDREKEFVKMFYGIGYDYPMDYETIAERENSKGLRLADGRPKTITKERVRQIVTGAVNKMKNA